MIKNVKIPFRFFSDNFSHWFIIDLNNIINSISNLQKAYFLIIIVLSLIMIFVN